MNGDGNTIQINQPGAVEQTSTPDSENEIDALGEYMLSRGLDPAHSVALLASMMGVYIAMNTVGEKQRNAALADVITVMCRAMSEFMPVSSTTH